LSQLSIGQGRLLVTPLHLAMLVSAVAADGELWRPRLLETEQPFRLPSPLRPETARRVRGIMRDAVRTGTGRGADIPGLDVCGKTGTAQNPGGDDHAWFACLAPASNPQFALVVLVENAGYGSRSALPVAAAILREAAARGHIVAGNRP
jgi:cell division protein FtsI/penicillin-binding protein 2